MQSAEQLHGALIADVVGSRSRSRLRSSLNEKLRTSSIAQMDDHLIRIPYAVTAGDEFQTVAARLERIPSLILDLRRRLYSFRLRIGIGIGRIEGPIRAPVNRVSGAAFGLARAAINQAKTSRKYPTLTVFRSGRADFDEIANLIYGLHDTLLQQITRKQWETIAMYFLKKRVDHTARALSVDISTASRNLKRGYFWQLEDTSLIMGNIIRRTFP